VVIAKYNKIYNKNMGKTIPPEVRKVVERPITFSSWM